MRRRLLISLIAFLVLGTLAGTPLFAATRNWTGTTSGTWSDPSNWGGTAPSAGDDLVFSSGNNGSSMNNDYPANTAFHSLSFSSGNSWDLSGNAIDIDAGGITVTGGANFNTSTPLTLIATQTWSCDAPGVFASQAIDLGANTLNISGSSHDFGLQGTINGTGGITVGGTVVAVFIAPNLNYTGPTTVNSGATLTLDTLGNIDTPFTIASGGTFTVPPGYFPFLSSTLALNGGSTYAVEIDGAGSGQYSQTNALGASAGVTLAGNLTITSNTVIPAGSALTILDTEGGATLTGTFTGLPDGATVSSGVQSYLINYTSSSVTLTALAGTTAPPSLAKSFASDIPVGGSTSLTFTVKNPNSGASLSGIGFNDPLPGGLVVATPNGLSGSCGGGTITATAGSGSISLSGGTLAASSTCTFSVDVTGTTAGALNNQTTKVTSTEGGNGNQATATLNVFAPPTIAKAFGASAIPSGATTTLTFTLGNPLSNPGFLTGVNFTDSLPSGMTVATPNGASTDCSAGALTAPAGASLIVFNNANISAGATCTVVVNVTSNVPGTANNTSGAVGSHQAPGGSTASASLDVLAPGVTAPPALSKSFGAAQIPIGGATSLTFTVTNLNSGTALTNVGFNDPLPAGLAVSTPCGLSGSCVGGTITAADGSTSVTLSGATIPANSACSFSVNVTGTSAGEQDNQTSNVTSTEGGPGNRGKATVAVVGPPTISKTFGASAITAGGTVRLTFTFGNPASNSVPLTNIAVSDPLPAGMTVANPPNGVDNCIFGSSSTGAGASTVSLSGASIQLPGTTCTFAIDVTSSTPGPANNTTGNVSSDNGGTGSTASASVTILSPGSTAPPSISKAFGAATIAVGGSTSLTFTLNNPNASTSLTNVGFSDFLPAHILVATPNGLSGSCGGGTITATAGGSGVSLSAATLAASTGCTFSVNVIGTDAGTVNNQTSNVTSNEGGNGNQGTANVTVLGPPTIAKAFGVSSMSAGATTTLTFTLGNPAANPLALSGVAFSDSLPSGMTVASPAGATTTCNGAIFTPAAGDSTLSLSSATINSGSTCTATVNVTSNTPGSANNTTGAVSSTNGGTGSTAKASVMVTTPVTPPSIGKAFGAATIAVGGSTSLTFTLNNPNSGSSLTSVGFNDPLPAGLTVATPNALSGSCGGGTITATAGSSSVSLSGTTLAAGAGCTFSVNVTGTSAGAQNNQTTKVTSTEGGNGNQGTASVTVLGPPTIAKAFGVSSMSAGSTTTLTFTLGNPSANPLALSGVAFSDSLPSGMTVASPTGATTTCSGATFTPVAGASTVSLSGATINSGATCTATVNVTSNTAGSANNTTGAVSSTNGGTGSTANASLTVTSSPVTPPSIAKAFGASTVPIGGSTSLTFTLNNPNSGSSLTSVGFNDPLPAGLTVATPNGLSGSCGGGTITATAGSGSVSLSGATLAASAGCTFSVNITGTSAGSKNNQTTNVTSTEGGNGNLATASVTVLGPPTIAKAFGVSSMSAGAMTTLTFTLGNPATNPLALSGVSFSDSLPSGMTVASPPGATTTCSGATFTPLAGASIVSLNGTMISSGATCTATVNVTSTKAGAANNTTGTVSSANGGTGSTASASMTITAATPSAIPALSIWALLLLALALALIAGAKLW